MKINSNYKYREIAGSHYLIPVGVAAEKSIAPIQLTETASWIWNNITEITQPSLETLAKKMTEEYAIDYPQAYSSIKGFLEQLYKQGLLE